MLVQLTGLCCHGGKASIRTSAFSFYFFSFFPCLFRFLPSGFHRPDVNVTAKDILNRLRKSHLHRPSRRVESWLSSTSSAATLELSNEVPQRIISLAVQRRVKALATTHKQPFSWARDRRLHLRKTVKWPMAMVIYALLVYSYSPKISGKTPFHFSVLTRIPTFYSAIGCSHSTSTRGSPAPFDAQVQVIGVIPNRRTVILSKSKPKLVSFFFRQALKENVRCP